jgi:hypothetical protein
METFRWQILLEIKEKIGYTERETGNSMIYVTVPLQRLFVPVCSRIRGLVPQEE